MNVDIKHRNLILTQVFIPFIHLTSPLTNKILYK